ncbi:helix-turn-helix domain-containing protein [Ilumatobacter sp.]|uniref:helix-turn-helix domain-containing protein n=1 Tax=Ilumatobacter sp. TaxID=1967498 RepID=UPI003C3F209B
MPSDTDNAGTADVDIDDLVRSRLRAIRQHVGWSLDELAERTGVGASTISRLETGHRSISFDVLVPLARALDVSVDDLVTSERSDDIVIRPEPVAHPGMTVWALSKPSSETVAIKMLLEPVDTPPDPNVHPGHDWLFVLTGSVLLTLGERKIQVRAGESAEFPTMTPHAVNAIDGPAEVIMVFDRNGARTHLSDT